MTTERRLAKLEAALPPSGVVRRWLIEAHEHDDLTAYVRAFQAREPYLLPLDRLIGETRAHAEVASRGRSQAERERAVRIAIGQTAFLFHLILRTIVLAEEALDREELVQVGLAAHLDLAASDDGRNRRSVSPNHSDWLMTLRDAALVRAEELQALEAARSRVEATYLDGQASLFPGTLRRWVAQRDRTAGLAALAVRLAELDGLALPAAPGPVAFEARVSVLVADHVEPARSEALDDLGDGHRAAAVARRWVGSKLA